MWVNSLNLSAIFSSLTNNLYHLAVVPQDNLRAFLDGGYQNHTHGDPNLFRRLEKKECIQDYGVQLLSARRDLIVIVDAPGRAQIPLIQTSRARVMILACIWLVMVEAWTIARYAILATRLDATSRLPLRMLRRGE
jgi:hypothetical protein